MSSASKGLAGLHRTAAEIEALWKMHLCLRLEVERQRKAILEAIVDASIIASRERKPKSRC